MNEVKLNIKNDLLTIDTCIKKLRKFELEGKIMYAKCAMAFIFTKDIDDELKKKNVEVKELVDQVCQPGVMIETIVAQVSKEYDEISLLEDMKTRIT